MNTQLVRLVVQAECPCCGAPFVSAGDCCPRCTEFNEACEREIGRCHYFAGGVITIRPRIEDQLVDEIARQDNLILPNYDEYHRLRDLALQAVGELIALRADAKELEAQRVGETT